MLLVRQSDVDGLVSGCRVNLVLVGLQVWLGAAGPNFLGFRHCARVGAKAVLPGLHPSSRLVYHQALDLVSSHAVSRRQRGGSHGEQKMTRYVDQKTTV